jgi:hypothetical protein
MLWTVVPTLLFCNLFLDAVHARSIFPPWWALHSTDQDVRRPPTNPAQHALKAPVPPRLPPPRNINSDLHFDAQENSVGVLFTTAESPDDVVHFWLPLGKTVYTRELQPYIPIGREGGG